MNNALQNLIEHLTKLPGIGPRQAKRLAYWLLQRESSFVRSFAEALRIARESVTMCPSCKRLHVDHNRSLCSICASEARNRRICMIVERDVDLENIERTGAYSGRYFVLGGTVSPLDLDPEKKIRLAGLLAFLADPNEVLEEVILACSATTEGEDTAYVIEEKIIPVTSKRGIRVTRLGRGLSTGTELEYVDRDTMDHALKRRG